MIKTTLFLLAAFFAATGVFMFAAPLAWYEATPGVSMMGPFNQHFVRDVGLVFIASAAGLALGAARDNRDAALIGAAWPAMHAVFHIVIWVGRGAPADLVAAVNLFGIQAPAWLALWAAARLPRFGEQS
ncbi:MAG: hypothetical protein AAFX03_07805 [Pseudomonadota bacterium]